jgi:hypothetical protein
MTASSYTQGDTLKKIKLNEINSNLKPINVHELHEIPPK